MWILQFLPNWIFYLLFCAALIAFLVAYFVQALPQAKLIQASSIVVAAFSIFMIGAISNNQAWLARVSELEAKVTAAEIKSTSVNTDIVQKTITKTQIIRERGQNIVSYVDREVIKFDVNCAIPREFVLVHNQAAEASK
jgi:hypothetical protein